MRVSIEHSQKQTGLFSKTDHYLISVTVEFSEAERHILKKSEDFVVLERGPSSTNRKLTAEEQEEFYNVLCLRISDLLKGTDTFAVLSPAEAKTYDASLREALKDLKAHIESNSSAPVGADTFEL